MALPRPATFCAACATRLERDTEGRPRCPACGFVWYPDPKVAVGVLAERDGRLLLVRRNHEPRMGEWAFPSGYVDAGEVIEEAAAREVREETGVEVRLDALLGVFSERGNPVIFVAYAGTITEGEPAPGPEASEVGLFDPDALPPLAFEHDPEVVTAWRDYRQGRSRP
jgi:8-oxo-dGTP diphosphatase